MSEERRCDKCDRLIRHWNAHDGLDCENWPEWQAGVKEYEYCGFTVRRYGVGKWWFGLGASYDTPNECFAAIDSASHFAP